MNVQVRIERGGVVVDTLTLGQGDHGIGRAPDNAVVLDDKAVSSRHALLRVHEAKAELIDQGSLNGIFVDNEKIGKIAFDRALAADICGLRLVFAVQDAPKKRFPLPAVARLRTRTGVALATAVLTCGVFLAAWLPARQAFKAFSQREALERGVLLARSLAEQNVVPLAARLPDKLRTASVAAEEGVRQAVVIDPHGKVLAPAQELGKVLGTPQIRKAVKEPGLSLWTGPDGDVILACPIRDGQALLGLALVAYRPGLAFAPLDGHSGTVWGLLVAVLLGSAAAWAILRLTLGPVRALAEDIGVALKSGSRELAVATASREIAELKAAVERLLVLAPAGVPGQEEASQASQASQASRGSGAPSAPAEAEAPAAGPEAAGPDAGAWCLLDLANYRLLGWSPAFAAFLHSRELAPPVHLLAAMADAAVLAAVAGAVDDPAVEAARPVENHPLAARKEPGPEPGTVRVRITEAV